MRLTPNTGPKSPCKEGVKARFSMSETKLDNPVGQTDFNSPEWVGVGLVFGGGGELGSKTNACSKGLGVPSSMRGIICPVEQKSRWT